MRHRASRPLIDLWRRLPRATARPFGAVARLSPVRALVALLVMLGLGTGVFVAVASDGGGSSHRPSAPEALGPRPDPATSRAGERPTLTDEKSTTATPTAHGKSPEPSTPPASESQASSPTESVDPSAVAGLPSTLRSKLDQATSSPSVPATPSTKPSQKDSASSSAAAKDLTPPNTSVSRRFPAGDSAVFSFSASESASYACSLDGSTYSSCGSPTSYSDLDPGWHTFSVRAEDAAGNVDPTPATVRWHASGGPTSDDD